ncbi:MAG TPA: peptidoglycan-binding domain-containing protein [Gaiellaceae bacterium]|nr:peptidoglycan-binding domain-containing protein [Gaiellaceae bacterium]
MEGHNGPTEPDPDDWFSEPDVAVATGERAPAPTTAENADVDDWLGDAGRTPARRRRRSSRAPSDPRVWIAVGLGLVILLIVGLALGGVFNSKSKPTTPIITLTSPAATTTSTQTTPSNHTVVVVPGAPLKPGDTGAQVKLLQTALNHLGYSVGKVDGNYGPATTQAVKNFQTAKGLTADGVAGPQTLAAMSSALKS